MDLPVAVGVQEDTVVCSIPATVRPPDHMMVVPSRKSGDLLVAHRTEAVLVFPQVQQLPATFEGVRHLHAEAFFEVHFPLWLIRIGCAFDFAMPLNGHVACTTKHEFVGFWGPVPVPTKVHCRPLCVRKYFFAPQRRGFFGCLRVAQDHRLLKMAVSTLVKTTLLTT